MVWHLTGPEITLIMFLLLYQLCLQALLPNTFPVCARTAFCKNPYFQEKGESSLSTACRKLSVCDFTFGLSCCLLCSYQRHVVLPMDVNRDGLTLPSASPVWKLSFLCWFSAGSVCGAVAVCEHACRIWHTGGCVNTPPRMPEQVALSLLVATQNQSLIFLSWQQTACFVGESCWNTGGRYCKTIPLWSVKSPGFVSLDWPRLWPKLFFQLWVFIIPFW